MTLIAPGLATSRVMAAQLTHVKVEIARTRSESKAEET